MGGQHSAQDQLLWGHGGTLGRNQWGLGSVCRCNRGLQSKRIEKVRLSPGASRMLPGLSASSPSQPTGLGWPAQGSTQTKGAPGLVHRPSWGHPVHRMCTSGPRSSASAKPWLCTGSRTNAPCSNRWSDRRRHRSCKGRVVSVDSSWPPRITVFTLARSACSKMSWCSARGRPAMGQRRAG